MNDEKRLSASGESLYALLGLSKDCTQDEIKRQYRKKALKCRPDKNPDNPDAAETFKELNHANRILSDEKKRKVYDYHGSMGIQAVEMMGDGVIPVFLLVSSRWFQWLFWCTFCMSGCCCCLCCCSCCFNCCNGCGGRCKLCKPSEDPVEADPSVFDAAPEEVHTSQPKSSSSLPSETAAPSDGSTPNEATALNPSETKTSYSAGMSASS
uniref:DnaJ homolog subfamily C member 5 n=1 Tax=Caligus clemensi TaxID=344056 RepID=C1C041_CALCM|nr:DnaJ homolog subfamily C member 5 [Caligus clemensi]